MIVFGQRKRIAAQFEKWCEENGVVCCALSMIGYLQGMGLLDEDKVFKYLESIDAKADGVAGIKEFKKEKSK